MNQMVPPPGLLVRHVTGLDARRGQSFALRIDNKGVRLFRNDGGGVSWSLERHEQWSGVSAVDIAPNKATRANLGALAVFGVLGLAARREPETQIAVSTPDSLVLVSSEASTVALRAAYSRLVEASAVARGKIRLEGQLLGDKQPPFKVAKSGQAADRLRQLVLLREEGLLSEAEFEVKRSEIMKDL